MLYASSRYLLTWFISERVYSSFISFIISPAFSFNHGYSKRSFINIWSAWLTSSTLWVELESQSNSSTIAFDFWAWALSWVIKSPLLPLNPLSSIHFPTSSGAAFPGNVAPSSMSCFCTASSFAGLRFPLSSSLLVVFQIRFLALPPNHQRIFQTTGNAPQIPAPSHASVKSGHSSLTALNSKV